MLPLAAGARSEVAAFGRDAVLGCDVDTFDEGGYAVSVDLHDAGGDRFSRDGTGDGYGRALVVRGREAAFVEFASIESQCFADSEV